MATKFQELENRKKMGVEPKHCIISSNEQFNGKIKKHNLKYLLNFLPLNFAKYQQKNLQYLKLLYFINYWWTIEKKSLYGTK